MLGLDYSAGRPGGAAIEAAGYDFVIRYCGQPNNPKCATRAEVDDLLAHGVAVALVFESYASRSGEGFAAGVADAQAAVAHQAALGIPASRPIYYAVDYDADPSVVEPYFRGVASVAGPDAAYGSYRVVQRLQGDGLASEVWQTVAWSRGQLLPSRDVFQRFGTVYVGGVACDVNEAITADFGQYPVEDEMTPEDVRAAVLDFPVGTDANGKPITLSFFLQANGAAGRDKSIASQTLDLPFSDDQPGGKPNNLVQAALRINQGTAQVVATVDVDQVIAAFKSALVGVSTGLTTDQVEVACANAVKTLLTKGVGTVAA